MNGLTTLIGTIVSSYIPGDYSIKSLIGQGITQGLNEGINTMKDGNLLWNSKKKQVVIRNETPMYNKMEEYLIEKFIRDFRCCELIAKRGTISYSLSGAFQKLCDQYKGHNIFITTETDKQEQKDAVITKLMLSSPTASVYELRDYISGICDLRKCAPNTIKIYRSMIIRSGKKKESNSIVEWEELNVKTSKTVQNTFSTDEVKKDFFEDVHNFLSHETETWFFKKGLPYKRGYVLHGPPGTGKTSSIKAIANRYSLDLFCIDLECVQTNNELSQLISKATYMANNRPHIMALEDIDRCGLFSRFNTSDLSVSTFLNLIDGVVESYGRILILTVNDLGPLSKITSNALLRPGRIDKQVFFDRFDESRVKDVIQFYYELGNQEVDISIDTKIAPAELLKILQSYSNLDQLEKVKELLSSKKESTTVIENPKKVDNRKDKELVLKRKRELRWMQKKKKTAQKFLEIVDDKIEKAEELLEKAKEYVKRQKERRKKQIAQARKKKSLKKK